MWLEPQLLSPQRLVRQASTKSRRPPSTEREARESQPCLTSVAVVIHWPRRVDVVRDLAQQPGNHAAVLQRASNSLTQPPRLHTEARRLPSRTGEHA